MVISACWITNSTFRPSPATAMNSWQPAAMPFNACAFKTPPMNSALKLAVALKPQLQHPYCIV
jgi:hypothetical protein